MSCLVPTSSECSSLIAPHLDSVTNIISDSRPISGTGLNINLRKPLSTAADPASPPDRPTLKERRISLSKATARPPIQPSPMPSAVTSQSSTKPNSAVSEDAEHSFKTEEDPQWGLFNQVSEWLQHEKVRRNARKARRAEAVSNPSDGAVENTERSSGEHHRSSESTFSLDKLESILLKYANVAPGPVSRQANKRANRRRPKGLRRGSASESDYTDLEAPVPSVEAYLDNSKTLAYSGGAGEDEAADSSSSSKRGKGREAWNTFKTEIVRLAHTLQLRGWRKVLMENAADIEVVRLSGAMTNAIYVVGPPKNLPIPTTSSSSSSIVPRRPPP